MSTTLVQRDPADADYLYAAWLGELGHGAQVECGNNETLVFCDNDNRAIATIGPGRTALTPEAYPGLAKHLERHLLSRGPTVQGFFITQVPQESEEVEVTCGTTTAPDGRVVELAAWALVTYQVENAQLFAETMSKVEDGELSIEEEEAEGEEDEEDEVEGGDTLEDVDNLEGGADEEEDEGPDAVEYFLRQALRTAVTTIALQNAPPDAQLNAVAAQRLAELMTPGLLSVGLKVLSSAEVIVSRGGEPVV